MIGWEALRLMPVLTKRIRHGYYAQYEAMAVMLNENWASRSILAKMPYRIIMTRYDAWRNITEGYLVTCCETYEDAVATLEYLTEYNTTIGFEITQMSAYPLTYRMEQLVPGQGMLTYDVGITNDISTFEFAVN